MITVWKYILNFSFGEQTIRLPSGAKILHVGIQHDNLMLWALVDTNPHILFEQRHFFVSNTGGFIPYPPSQLEHIATLILDYGNFVIHIFELKKNESL